MMILSFDNHRAPIQPSEDLEQARKASLLIKRIGTPGSAGMMMPQSRLIRQGHHPRRNIIETKRFQHVQKLAATPNDDKSRRSLVRPIAESTRTVFS